MTLFSKRNRKPPTTITYDSLPDPLRVQIVNILERTLGHLYEFDQGYYGYGAVLKVVADERGIHYLHELTTPRDDVLGCVSHSEDVELVLDVIDVSCRLMRNVQGHELSEKEVAEAINKLNRRFEEHGVGYRFDSNAKRLVRIDNDLTYADVIAPALSLLADPRYSVPNDEYGKALQDYRTGEWGDCLTKCCAAFESVLKIVLDQRTGTHDPNANVNVLIKLLVPELSWPDWMNTTLIQVATIRNKLGSAHGGGMTPRDPGEAFARYALSVTAANILLVTDAATR